MTIEAQLDLSIEDKRRQLDAYRSREHRVAEAHTQRIEAECAEAVHRAKNNMLRDDESIRRMALETRFLELAFEQIQERARSGEPLFPRLTAPPARALPAPVPAPVILQPQVLPARAEHPAAERLLEEMRTAMDAMRTELSADAKATQRAVQEHAGEVAGLARAVQVVRDEFPAAFRYEGPLHD